MHASSLMATYKRQAIRFTHGKGAWLFDEHETAYLDATSGVGVTNLGHAHPEIAAVIADQATRLIHTSNMYEIEWQERLGQRLCTLATMDRVFFANSGAEANEAALKLARRHAQRKGLKHPCVIVLENSFHGRTLATLAASHYPAIQRAFEPLMPGFVHVPLNDIEALQRYADRSLQICAVLVEAVQGEGGVHIADPSYLQTLRTLCTQHDWLLMMDEIQSGLGRTGRWFAYQHAGIQPDVITLAKALGNGFPIGACLARGQAAELFTPGSHGSTFGGNPLGCRIGMSVIDILERDDLPASAAMHGTQLIHHLKQHLADHPPVKAIRGCGLMIGIELHQPCTDLVRRALVEEQLLINVTRERTIRLLPALVSNSQEISCIANRLTRILHHDG